MPPWNECVLRACMSYMQGGDPLTNAPSAGEAAQIVINAPGAGNRTVIRNISATVKNLAVTLNAPVLQIKEGAVVVWQRPMTVLASNKNEFDFSPNIKFAPNTEVTVEFASGISLVTQTISLIKDTVPA